jgi:hypothetical protein
MPRPSLPSLEHPNNIQSVAQSINLLLMHYRPASFHFRPLGQKSLLSTLFVNITSSSLKIKKTTNMVPKPTNAHKGIKIIKTEKPRFPSAQNKKEAKSHYLLAL